MSTENITFDSDSNYKFKSRVLFGQAEVPGMTKFLLRKGIVKNEKQATFIMFMMTAILLSASVFIIYSNFFGTGPIPPPPVFEDEPIINQEPSAAN